MRKILITIIVTLLVTAQAAAGTDAELVARSITTYEQIESIRSAMRDAVGDLADEQRAYELAIRELDNEPKSPEQLDELAKDIVRHKESLKRFEANGSESAIAYNKRRIRDLTVMLEGVSLDTDDERKAFRQKYQPKVDELAAKVREIQAPYQERIKAIEGPAGNDNEALKAVISRYIKAPASRFPGSSVKHVNATAHMAFAAGNWYDADDAQVAWAHIRIRSQDEIQDFHRENLLDDAYPIQSLSDGSMWVWAGHFLITFVADHDDLKGKDTIQQVIHEFIDLEGLASISAEPRRVAAGE